MTTQEPAMRIRTGGLAALVLTSVTDLGNGDGTGTITLDAAFDTGVIGAPTPSASPAY
jgi:hypothetical protein